MFAEAATPGRGALDFVVAGDLHARPPGPGREAFDEAAFVSLLECLREDGRRDQRSLPRLLLLGDTFDLPPPGCDRAHAGPSLEGAAAFRELTEVFPRLFGALRGWVAGGGQIDFVLGNHDVALADHALQQALRAACGATGPRRKAVRVHPWFLHVPGLLHAQHGHQLHDVHAHATPLRPCAGIHALGLPPAARLDELRRGTAHRGARRSLPFVETAAALASWAVRASSPAPAAVRARYRATTLAPYAGQSGLPLEALIDLDRLSEASAPQILRRLARRGVEATVRRHGAHADTEGVPAFLDRPDPRDGYMLRAWRDLDGVLRRHGAGVPVVCLGHTHVPRRLRGPEGSVLLNPGAWLRRPRGRGGAFARVTRAPDGAVSAALLWWDGEQATALPPMRGPRSEVSAPA